jgi:peptidoglycan hydrolase CwlO-like protein
MKQNSLLIIVAIIVVAITSTLLYNNKLNNDFGINQLKDYRVHQATLESEISTLDEDINEFKTQLKSKQTQKEIKVAERVMVEKKIKEIETAVYYLNRSLGRDT